MELSKAGKKLLGWMAAQNRWLQPRELETGCNEYTLEALKYLKQLGLVEVAMSGGESWASFRINEAGRAALRMEQRLSRCERREWINLAIALLALLVSIIALA